MENLRSQLQQAREESIKHRAREAAANKLLEDVAKLSQDNTNLEAETDALHTAEQETITEDRRQIEFLQAFPTETQLLKLERRLESVKTALSDAEKSSEQLKTGIDAYRVRSDVCSTARKDLADNLDSSTNGTLIDVTLKANDKSDSKPASAILDAIDELVKICEDRESSLLRLNQEYAQKMEEDATVTERISTLQRKVELELPRIESDADRFMKDITGAWAREKEALLAAYDKLYAINKEQQFHLQRGTHVKRSVTGVVGNHETALSARHAKLSAQLIDAIARLQELSTENSFTKRVTDQLRSEGRESLHRFDSQKQEVAARLEDAHHERVAAEAEARRFRNLKADLQQALLAIRDTPSGTAKTQ